MKIKSTLLKNFISRIYLDGVIEKCLIDFGKEGMKVELKNPSGVLAMVGFLPKDKFEEYKELGVVPIGNLDMLSKKLAFFNDDIVIVKEQEEDGIERLVLKGNTTHKHMLSEIDSFDSFEIENKIDGIEFDEEIDIDVNIFKDTIKCAGIYEANRMTLELSKKEIKTIIGKRYLSEETAELEKELKNEYSFILPIYIFKIMKELKTKTNFKIATAEGNPVIMKNNEDGVEFTYILMPSDE